MNTKEKNAKGKIHIDSLIINKYLKIENQLQLGLNIIRRILSFTKLRKITYRIKSES